MKDANGQAPKKSSFTSNKQKYACKIKTKNRAHSEHDSNVAVVYCIINSERTTNN